jgi:hypothetical protein
MDYPPEWDFFPMEDFVSAGPRNPGDLGVEVLAQVRPNGRILDHFQVTLGGSKILDVNVGLANVLNVPAMGNWRLKFQLWPCDLEIRRNMTSTTWLDVGDLVATKDGHVQAESGEAVDPEAVAAQLKEINLAYRFAVVVGEDERLQLQLQMMPASAATLMGKPVFRG